ncbi:hypothetical protein BJX61DRAFT_433478 [Aspergillus egyptiacus]|nr:hypothetical protein BJX61DRAFT_433478 [Aspergillus egyptiacus]
MSAHEPNPGYPFTVLDLRKEELDLLVGILTLAKPTELSSHAEKRAGRETHRYIRSAIRKLPSNLRKSLSILILPSVCLSLAPLCSTHNGLNPYITNDIFRLIQCEVKDQLDFIAQYSPEPLLPEIEPVVSSLQSLQGMWRVSHQSNHRSCNIRYQENKCEACIIARILSSPFHLRNLRATLESRTRTKCKYRVPRLSPVVDAALATMDEHIRRHLEAKASHLAVDLKTARKRAFRNMMSHARDCDRNCMRPSPGRSQLAEKGTNANPSPRRSSVSSTHTVTIYVSQEIAESDISSPTSPRLEGEPYTPTTRDGLLDDIIAAYKDTPEESNSVPIPSPTNIHRTHITRNPYPLANAQHGEHLLSGGNGPNQPSINSTMLYQALLEDCSHSAHGSVGEILTRCRAEHSSLERAQWYAKRLRMSPESCYSRPTDTGRFSDIEASDYSGETSEKEARRDTTWSLVIGETDTSQWI